jgi:hypothetical protein
LDNPQNRSWLRRVAPPVLVVLGVIAVFWKLVLTNQYTMLASFDPANQVMPWLQTVVFSIRHFSIALWTPYEWFGQSLIGEVQPGVTSPFSFLLALAPLHNGQIQVTWVQLWFVLIHCVAGLFAYWFLTDVGATAAAAAVGGIFYATAGFCGNTDWPQQLASGIWAPLVFLFLFRSLRGRAPLKSAAWGGVALGTAWLCGHHAPPLALSLAVAGVGIAMLVRAKPRREVLLRLAVLFTIAGLVSAVQVLPADEYGKLAKRWTATGALTWNQKVEFPEHQASGIAPADLVHVVMPGGTSLRSDPFVGIVGLSLAALAVWCGFRRRDVRILVVLGACALLYALARFDALYGLFYALVPLVEKSRAPIVELSVFHFAMAALVGYGAHLMFTDPEHRGEHAVSKALVWFGGITFAVAVLAQYVKVDLDSRIGMVALLALATAGVYQAWSRGYLRREWALALVGLLIIVDQGNEVGWSWAHIRDTGRMQQVWALYNTLDIADFLRHQPGPKRLEINDKDVQFSFGDWYRIDSSHSMTASMLTATSELGGWWSDRVVRMYGMNYVLSRTPTRDGLKEVFWGRSGIKAYYNPTVFPRAWTVHQTALARDDEAGRSMVNNGPMDLRTTAVMVGNAPHLDQCGTPDQVTAIDERQSSVRIDVEMACTGLLVVSDNWYPGWRAQVDGRYEGIWKVNTVIRGVVVPAGRHEVVMRYRPFSVYFGFALTLLGLAAAVVLQRRREPDRADYLNKSSS